jgi:hypothetical protein
MFCWLMKLVFEEADPKPLALRLTVGFDNLTRPSGAATLSTGRKDETFPRRYTLGSRTWSGSF